MAEDAKLEAGALSEKADELQATKASLLQQLSAKVKEIDDAKQAAESAAIEEATGLFSLVHSPQERQPIIPKPTAYRPTSSAHVCSGQIFQGREWMGKSCYFRNLCYDTAKDKFL